MIVAAASAASVIIVVLLAKLFVFFSVVIILEFHRFQILMDQVHEILPDRARPRCALQVIYCLRRVTADPDCRRIVMRKTAEPSVLGFVCCTGLACRRHIVVKLKTPSGSPSFLQNALKDTDHLSGRICLVDRFSFVIRCIDHFPCVIQHVVYTCGDAVVTVILQCSVARGHFHRLNAICKTAERCGERHISVHDIGEPHFLEICQSDFRGDILIDLPGDRIEGSLHRFPQLHLTVISAACVLGPVVDLFVFHLSPGIIPVLESRRIDYQRFDRTAGLPVTLEGAVQRESRVGLLRAAADHGDDMTGLVVDTDSCALHLPLSVIRLIREVLKGLVDCLLKLILHIHVEGGVDLVTALVKLCQAGVIHLIVTFHVGCPVLVAGEIISQHKPLHLHEGLGRTLVCIGHDIVVPA